MIRQDRRRMTNSNKNGIKMTVFLTLLEIYLSKIIDWFLVRAALQVHSWGQLVFLRHRKVFYIASEVTKRAWTLSLALPHINTGLRGPASTIRACLRRSLSATRSDFALLGGAAVGARIGAAVLTTREGRRCCCILLIVSGCRWPTSRLASTLGTHGCSTAGTIGAPVSRVWWICASRSPQVGIGCKQDEQDKNIVSKLP